MNWKFWKKTSTERFSVLPKAYVIVLREKFAQSVSDEELYIKMKAKYGTDDLVVIFTDKPVEVINEGYN